MANEQLRALAGVVQTAMQPIAIGMVCPSLIRTEPLR